MWLNHLLLRLIVASPFPNSHSYSLGLLKYMFFHFSFKFCARGGPSGILRATSGRNDARNWAPNGIQMLINAIGINEHFNNLYFLLMPMASINI